jgi:fatty acid desaturase
MNALTKPKPQPEAQPEPQLQLQPEHRSPKTGTVFLEGSPFWIVDGLAYDFTEWMKRHPGGALWFRTTQGRDISALFHSYHKDPQRLRKMLEKYRIEGFTEKDVLPKMGVPPFLVAPDFDASKDLPKYDFNQKSTLLDAIRRKLESTISKETLSRYDRAFDTVTLLIALAHVATMVTLVLGWLPAWACVGLLVVTRTALAGAGHYAIHQKWREGDRAMVKGLGKSLFDINYVGTCLIAADGHVLLHHPHLGTGADVKRTFFDGMLRLHPLLRIPGYTLHKFGICILGLMMRGMEIAFFERDKGVFRSDFWFIRLWLVAEFIACLVSGQVVAWGAQFVLSLWFNTFLVVASHDFEGKHEEQQLAALPEHLRDDWAARQIVLSYDLSVVGIRWIDVFLSAGLSPHRVHHVLPSQVSGFANIASEDAVREACAEAGIAWERPRHLLWERFPSIMKHYLLSPAKRLHGPPGAPPPRDGVTRELGEFSRYAIDGWRGVGV